MLRLGGKPADRQPLDHTSAVSGPRSEKGRPRAALGRAQRFELGMRPSIPMDDRMHFCDARLLTGGVGDLKQEHNSLTSGSAIAQREPFTAAPRHRGIHCQVCRRRAPRQGDKVLPNGDLWTLARESTGQPPVFCGTPAGRTLFGSLYQKPKPQP